MGPAYLRGVGGGFGHRCRQFRISDGHGPGCRRTRRISLSVRGRRGGRSRGRGRHIGHPGWAAHDPAPSRDPAPGPAAIAPADPAGAHTVTVARRHAFTVALARRHACTVAVAIVRAWAAGLHTFAVAIPDGLTQPLANPVGVPGPDGNAYA